MLQFRKICAGSRGKSDLCDTFEDAQMQFTCFPDDISGKLLERFRLRFVGSAWPLGTGDVGQVGVARITLRVRLSWHQDDRG